MFMRGAASIAVNTLIPGGGLILVRRERQGAPLAFCFGFFASLGIVGGWITPGSIPPRMTLVCLFVAAIVWIAAQIMLWVHVWGARDPGLHEQKAALLQLASEALQDGIYVNARVALESALRLNDEDVLANLLWARLMTLTGRFPEARRAWRRVEELDREKEFQNESAAALRQIPAEH